VLLVRAIATWVVTFALLLLVAGTIGLISRYEFWIVFAVSIGVTFLVLRLWDRRHPEGPGGTPSS
jgi:hypothetical protein